MESFSLLFKKYKEPFISFANSYLHDRVAAEDIYGCNGAILGKEG